MFEVTPACVSTGWPPKRTIDHLTANKLDPDLLPYVPKHFRYPGLLWTGDLLTRDMLPTDPDLKPPCTQRTIDLLMSDYVKHGTFVKLGRHAVARLWILHRFHQTAARFKEARDPNYLYLALWLQQL
jgi:hypothetical protein